MKTWLGTAALAAAIFVGPSAFATPQDFSFQGTFTLDNDVQEFTFTTSGSSDVILRTWGYAGGTNAAGDTIDQGGFDPILALFNASTGELINQNDDGDCSQVGTDSKTGNCYDTYLDIGALAAGQYIATIMQWDNTAKGPNLSDGFVRDGQGNFTAVVPFNTCPDNQPAFNDVTGVAGCGRTDKWAFDILGVDSASTGGTPPPDGVPEPLSMSLFAAGLAGLGFARRKRA